MTNPDTELLGRYARHSEESAFAELVDRYADLVYSAALRQAADNPNAAEEITQAVFVDLARKASGLVAHGSLAGWLYASTRLSALEHRRAEARRRQREARYASMNDPATTQDSASEANWSLIRPVLDEAMAVLPQEDREAVLIRFFERRPLADVGLRLGLTENAARMRIQRALSKLQSVLERRGILSTATALGIVLEQNAVLAAPEAVISRVRAGALSSNRVPPEIRRGGRMAKSLALTAILGSALVAVFVSSWGYFQRPSPFAETTQSDSNPSTLPTAMKPGDTGSGNAPAAAGSALLVDTSLSPNVLELQILDKGLENPIPGAELDQSIWTEKSGRGLKTRKVFADRTGRLRIPIPTNALRVQFTTRVDRFLDTQMRWDVVNGEQVPAQYVVRLDRAPLIGGRVVDAKERPVPNAEVTVFKAERPSDRHGVESHEFGEVIATTDAEGRWALARIASEFLERSLVWARHAEYQPSPSADLEREPGMVAALRNQSLVLHLGDASTLRGVVTDASGLVVSNALVRVRNPIRRETRTTAYGEFSLQGCPVGSYWLNVEADGFAPRVLAVRPPLEEGLVRVRLDRASTVRIRVVQSDRKPVPNALVACVVPGDEASAAGMPDRAVLAEFDNMSDANGCVVWTNAPAGDLAFECIAEGFEPRHGVRIRADGTEQDLVLTPNVNLTLRGTVSDAANRTPIETFRIAVGVRMPSPFGAGESVQILQNESTWQQFGGGQFRHSFSREELKSLGMAPVVIRAEADGYEPWFSRSLEMNEGDVVLNVQLHKAAMRTLKVTLPDGSPAAGAELVLVRPNDFVWLKGSVFSKQRGEDTADFHRTDREGVVTMAVNPTDCRLLVAHPDGYLDVTTEALPDDSTLRISPWSKIRVELEHPDPEANQLWVLPTNRERCYLQLEWEEAMVSVDAAGTHTFVRVPPGDWEVRQQRPVVMPGGTTSGERVRSKYLHLGAGESVSVRLGGGHKVVGRFQLPEGTKIPRDDAWMGRIRWGVAPAFPTGVLRESPEFARWRQSPQIRARFDEIQRRSREIVPDAALRFVADGLEPGEYTLTLIVTGSSGTTEPGPGQIQHRTITMKAEKALVVPEGDTHDVLDLGVIPLVPL